MALGGGIWETPVTSKRALRFSLALWSPAAFLGGCSPGDSQTDGEFYEVQDSSGVQIVLNRGPDVGDAGNLSLEEDLRLGILEGDQEELLFFNILDILIDDSERVFVGNDQTGTVRVFDRNGVFIREFGGKGEGPSEIPLMLNDLMWAGDQVALIDWQAGGKTVLYDTTGKFSRSFRNTQPTGMRISLAGFTPIGWIGTESSSERPENPVPGQAYPLPVQMRRVAPSMDGLEEVLFDLPPRILYGRRHGGLDWPLFHPPGASGFDASGNHYITVSGQYRIDVRNPSGTLVRSIRCTHDPIPITDEDIEAYKELVRIEYDTLSWMSASERERQLQTYLDRIEEQASFPRPDFRPPLRTLLVGRDGSFWVERLDGHEPAKWWQERMSGGFGKTPTGETDWDLFSAPGRLIGSVHLPPRFKPMAVSEESVVGVLKDEFDVEYVVRYRVKLDGQMGGG